MALNVTTTDSKMGQERFVTLDIARGIAILLMVFVHIIHAILNIDYLMSDAVIVTQPIIALSVLVIIPFIGGLAGFFLLVSATSNMISMYKDLERGRSIRSLVFKQVLGGFLLLIFAMLCEGLIGYWGLVGDFFLNLNNPANTNWGLMFWRWNHFETIHAIAWCLIINGCIQGLLSLRGKWKNRRTMIITYIVMGIIVVLLTQPIWMLFNKIIPGYPFGTFPSGNGLDAPWIGTETFWEILRTPFVAIFASPVEPLFPYLAVSFVGSIIGIVLSKPKEEINDKFPRRMFLVGTIMFVSGLIGVLIIIFLMMNRNDFMAAAEFYMSIIYHRSWTPDNPAFTGVPLFAWLAQFLAVNGLSIMMLMFLFRLIEFRGKSKQFADRSKLIRRLGIVAFSNYNNQWFFFIMWELVSLLTYQKHYEPQQWGGTALIIVYTLGFYSLVLWGWEKIGYIGSLEWFIRTITNNVVPVRRQRFDKSVKWWQRGLIDVDKVFYNANWVNIHSQTISSTSSGMTSKNTTEEPREEMIIGQPKNDESKLALIIALVGFLSVLFVLLSFIALPLSIHARRQEGKNKQNKAALYISVITIILLITIILILFELPIGLLGLF
ncbi:MAG: hypothetical protein JXA54_09835 [Candidatus Heimdallarchaeota archaeon]|nr:hypothetical protein [Candidatus Heimdallarchaeota archaeon]